MNYVRLWLLRLFWSMRTPVFCYFTLLFVSLWVFDQSGLLIVLPSSLLTWAPALVSCSYSLQPVTSSSYVSAYYSLIMADPCLVPLFSFSTWLCCAQMCSGTIVFHPLLCLLCPDPCLSPVFVPQQSMSSASHQTLRCFLCLPRSSFSSNFCFAYFWACSLNFRPLR